MIKKIKLLLNVLAMCVFVMLTSCIDDSGSEQYYRLSIGGVLPDNAVLKSGKIVYKELNTGDIYTQSLPQYDAHMLPNGIYDIEATGDVEISEGDNVTTKHVRALATSVSVMNDMSVELNWFFFNPTNSLVFGEFYFTGSLNAKGTGGIRDTYIKIYNNTDEVQYADGLAICESAFVNAKTNTFEILTEANNRNVNFTAGTVWVIPGNGTDVPILPGESIKIVDQAIDWGAEVAGGLNHTDADFEWWDDNKQDNDVPTTPNLEKWYCYSLSIWVPSNQCNRSYALVRFPEGMNVDKFLAEQHGPYDYISVIGTEMRNEKAYLISNDWIIDGVNLGTRQSYVRGALSESIDMSYAPISDIDRDPARFGYKYVRKVATVTADGRKVLMDTDDSASDFILENAN